MLQHVTTAHIMFVMNFSFSLTVTMFFNWQHFNNLFKYFSLTLQTTVYYGITILDGMANQDEAISLDGEGLFPFPPRENSLFQQLPRDVNVDNDKLVEHLPSKYIAEC